ncbi:MAG: hypothetical protein L7G90_02110 [Candidatus Nanopusillus sp.]|nr:hypothetical protein [Candidatus Nanopusillus sp.]MCG2868516.1 hypothetical protein [Candidatus Nanopusillus sp.]MCG2882919.1 hypothetical protein [Candidatus Nanopusillus sp.]
MDWEDLKRRVRELRMEPEEGEDWEEDFDEEDFEEGEEEEWWEEEEW